METGLGVLRLSPNEFWFMTLGEFVAALDGWNAAQGGKKAAKAPPMTRDRLDYLMEKYPD